MNVTATLSYLRMSPRKVTLVAQLIRGQGVGDAQTQLRFFPKRAAQPLLKLLNSAVANAENNFKLEKDNLYIRSVIVNQGPALKRFQPRAFGRAAQIMKRSSHVTITLTERNATKVPAKKSKKSGADAPIVDAAEMKKSKEHGKVASKQETKKVEPVTRSKQVGDRIIHRRGTS
jgi:large subunit ribosomal protein L22